MDDEAIRDYEASERAAVEAERRMEDDEYDDPVNEMAYHDFLWALKDTRQEPGLPLDGMAQAMRQVLSNDEIAVLINRLNGYLNTELPF
jgi:hypothetical protein